MGEERGIELGVPVTQRTQGTKSLSPLSLLTREESHVAHRYRDVLSKRKQKGRLKHTCLPWGLALGSALSHLVLYKACGEARIGIAWYSLRWSDLGEVSCP